MSILLIAGSPSVRSRSSALLDHCEAVLKSEGHALSRIDIRSLDAFALVSASFDHPAIVEATSLVAQAQAIVVATPIYKAAYSGVLKAFLDLLPQSALQGKAVLPIATGGSAHHMLALDYALRPVLHSMAARDVLPGVYAIDAQVELLPEGGARLQPELESRLAEGLALLSAWVPVAVPARTRLVEAA